METVRNEGSIFHQIRNRESSVEPKPHSNSDQRAEDSEESRSTYETSGYSFKKGI